MCNRNKCPNYAVLENNNRNGCVSCISLNKLYDEASGKCVDNCATYFVQVISIER